LDSSTLLSYYQAQLSASPSAIAAQSVLNAQQSTSATNSATAKDVLPWTQAQPTLTAQQAKVLGTTNYLDTTNVPLSPGASSDGKMEQDNQKLFSLYNAVNSLAVLTNMAQSSSTTDGQRAGLNTRFQAGLAQIQQYLSSTTFNNYTLQAATPAATTTATAKVAISDDTYSTRQLVTNANVNNPLAGVSASDSFNIAVKKNGVTSNVAIDLSKVQGSLTLGNIVTYINSQMAAGGFSTRFQKVESGGTATSDANATYSLQITPGGAETISMSAAATPALYLAGNSGTATETSTVTNSDTKQTNTSPADQTGRLAKLSGLSTSPTSTFSVNQDASSGTTTAQATAVDSSGNVYVIGNATGSFGNQINQGTQDTYLTKYDSAGNVVWQQLLGSSGSASAYGMAIDPATGGVVVTGSSTAPLTSTSVANGNNDSFVASYDAQGNQTWTQQIQTLATNQSNAVSVDASGNIYIGGSVSGGVIGSGQTSQGGGDAFLVKLSSKGKVLAESQFGTSGADSVAATATGSDGSLYVASVQNGEAIVSKYAGGDITSAPTWSMDMGTLGAGGNVGGLAVSPGGQVYVSGSTSNTNLTAGGQASIAAASSGGTDAFVFALTDNGNTASANRVSYVGTSGTDQGGAVTVGADGTVYLAGTTSGTFAGQSRNIPNVTNAFATALNADGTVNWTRQLGGADGQSTGSGIAIDPNGSSVLDALGLPRGTISPNQTVDLAQNTTLRAGDSFQIAIEGTAARTATISIDQGETLDSLVTKINAQLGQTGTAKINYGDNTEALQITVNSGKTINLVAGPTGFDALSRLGITPGVLSAASTTPATTTSTSSSSTKATLPTYGLGLTATVLGPLDISTVTGADLTKSTLLTVMSNIQHTYQTSNAPPPTTTTKGNTTGTASAYTTSQLSSYNLALGLMNADPSNAYANIQSILAGASSGGSGSGSSGSSTNSDLTAALAALGAS
jgi:hypothetical protein